MIYFDPLSSQLLLFTIILVIVPQKLVDVLDFLRLPHRPMVSRHVKIHKKPLSKQVENWDEVSNALKGTEFESFLKSDYTL